MALFGLGMHAVPGFPSSTFCMETAEETENQLLCAIRFRPTEALRTQARVQLALHYHFAMPFVGVGEIVAQFRRADEHRDLIGQNRAYFHTLFARVLTDMALDHSSARSQFQLARDCGGYYCDTHMHLALLLHLQFSFYEAAQKLLNEALAINRRVPLLRLYAGCLSPDPATARRLLHSIHTSDLKPPDHHLGQAIIAANRDGDYDSAERLFAEAMRAAPTRTLPIFFAAMFFWKQRCDVDRAEALLCTALRLDGAFCEAHARLADLLARERGDVKQAAVHAQRVLDINPVHERAAEILCLALRDG